MSASVETTTARGPWPITRDYLALTKPSINRMCLLEAAGAMFLAHRGGASLGLGQALLGLIGTALAVASANALNMWLERDTDRLMRRTKDRPLAARRISSDGALVFGVTLGVASVALLALGTNLATTLIGLFAIVSYVGVYTPMKYKAPLALVVGAIPGAVPPLMGWTAVTGTLDAPGLILFGVLFVWQMPHFIAISVVRRRDYAAAGILTVPGVRGLANAKWQALGWSLALLPTSLALCATGVVGVFYGVVAGVASAAFIALTAAGMHDESPAQDHSNRWAHRLFIASLIYLPVLVAGLAIDVLL